MLQILANHVWVILGFIVSASPLAIGEAEVLKSQPGHWLTMSNDFLTVGVDKDLHLNIYQGPRGPIWRTSRSATPAFTTARIERPDGSC